MRASLPRATFQLHSAFRTPHSALRISFLLMPVQAIAWTRSGAVRIVDQRALPEAHIERDLESAAAAEVHPSSGRVAYGKVEIKLRPVAQQLRQERVGVIRRRLDDNLSRL